MPADLHPEEVLKSLEKGQLAPFYLFYGPGEFRLEKTLEMIREGFIPEAARDLNQELFYGGEVRSSEIINHALSLPFLAQNRLIIVRRTENFTADELENFIPYLENPSESTCIIFVSGKTNFNMKFYKRFRSSGRAVNFGKLRENQVTPWIKRMAGELGLKIDGQTSVYLQHVVGNSLGDLYAELEKIQIRFGKKTIEMEDVEKLVIHSRVYTIFEFMNVVSEKNPGRSLQVLKRVLEEEDSRGGPLRVLGMLNRQVRLLWLSKEIADKGGRAKDVAKALGVPPFSARDFIKFSKNWTPGELERGIQLLYRADGLLKSGSRPGPVLENLVLSLCGERITRK
jgi:DNA polymerase-3 subunit delta